jgi:hypothetical protein
VLWVGATPSFGCCWWKSVIGVAFDQAASSSFPSIAIVPTACAAEALGSDTVVTGVVWAVAVTTPATTKAAATTMHLRRSNFFSLSSVGGLITRTLRVRDWFQRYPPTENSPFVASIRTTPNCAMSLPNIPSQ